MASRLTAKIRRSTLLAISDLGRSIMSSEQLFMSQAVKNELGYHFTCVEDGASTARYADELGDTHETGNFFVLALRHDPSDLAGTPPNLAFLEEQ